MQLEFTHDDLVTAVRRKVKDLILNNYLQPGSKIRQEDLARSLGVSRTPIIKALYMLVADNLVTYTSRRGFTVKELTTREMAEIFYVRELLEGACARETAEKATEDEIEELRGYFAGFGGNWDRETEMRYMASDKAFHERLYEIAAVPLILRINEMFSILRVSYQRGLFRDCNESLSEHLALIEAIRKRNADLAERLARYHTAQARAAMLKR